MEQVLDALGMTGLAVTSVGLWTLRVALAARGRKVAGAMTAAAEALVFLLAFSKVMTNMDEISRVIGYAVGVGIGTLLGLYLDERLSTGQSEVRIVTEGDDLALVTHLHTLGWPVTWTNGKGPFGEVTVAFVAVDDAKIKSLTDELERRSPESFWTVESLRKARAQPLGRGWIQVGRGLFRNSKSPSEEPDKSLPHRLRTLAPQ